MAGVFVARSLIELEIGSEIQTPEFGSVLYFPRTFGLNTGRTHDQVETGLKSLKMKK